MPNGNIKLVDNTGINDSMLHGVFLSAVDSGELPEEVSDLFTLTILKGFNDDGSDRGILNFA